MTAVPGPCVRLARLVRATTPRSRIGLSSGHRGPRQVVVADDVVSFGTVNLDSWALYRNSEIAMIARSAGTASLFEERLFEPDIARSHSGWPPSGVGEGIEGWLWDKLTYFL